MKKIRLHYFFTVLMAAMLSVCFVSCGDDDSDNGSGVSGGLYGWYIDMNNVAKLSDFNEINTAINNHELLSSYSYGGERHNYYAEYDLFVDSEGRYGDFDAHFGRLRFSIHSMCIAIQIVDDSTIKDYIGSLYAEGKGSGDMLYKINAGSIFGNMAYYGTPVYKTYTKMGDKLYLADGTIYTITSDGLVKDGESTTMKKYNPSIRY